MLVDYEAVVADLRAEIMARPNHGQRQLATKLNELEAKHRVEEGVVERLLRRYGIDFRRLEADMKRDDQPDHGDGTPVPAMAGALGHQSHEQGDDGHGRNRSGR